MRQSKLHQRGSKFTSKGSIDSDFLHGSTQTGISHDSTFYHADTPCKDVLGDAQGFCSRNRVNFRSQLSHYLSEEERRARRENRDKMFSKIKHTCNDITEHFDTALASLCTETVETDETDAPDQLTFATVTSASMTDDGTTVTDYTSDGQSRISLWNRFSTDSQAAGTTKASAPSRQDDSDGLYLIPEESKVSESEDNSKALNDRSPAPAQKSKVDVAKTEHKKKHNRVRTVWSSESEDSLLEFDRNQAKHKKKAEINDRIARLSRREAIELAGFEPRPRKTSKESEIPSFDASRATDSTRDDDNNSDDDLSDTPVVGSSKGVASNSGFRPSNCSSESTSEPASNRRSGASELEVEANESKTPSQNATSYRSEHEGDGNVKEHQHSPASCGKSVGSSTESLSKNNGKSNPFINELEVHSDSPADRPSLKTSVGFLSDFESVVTKKDRPKPTTMPKVSMFDDMDDSETPADSCGVTVLGTEHEQIAIIDESESNYTDNRFKTFQENHVSFHDNQGYEGYQRQTKFADSFLSNYGQQMSAKRDMSFLDAKRDMSFLDAKRDMSFLDEFQKRLDEAEKRRLADNSVSLLTEYESRASDMSNLHTPDDRIPLDDEMPRFHGSVVPRESAERDSSERDLVENPTEVAENLSSKKLEKTRVIDLSDRIVLEPFNEYEQDMDSEGEYDARDEDESDLVDLVNQQRMDYTSSSHLIDLTMY